MECEWDCVSTLVSHGCMHAVTVISLTFSRLGLFRPGRVACVCILPPAWPRPKHLQRALAHPGQMINYARTEWYGLGYLFRVRGSAFPRCIPPALIAAAINYVFLTWPSIFGGSDAGDWLGHPYTFQLVGIVFGYLMVTRINMSYSRYWEGVTMVKQMHSKWADACGQIISFDRSRSTECNLTSDPFCCHIVRLFSQMSAMATMRLHIVDPGESLLFDALEGKAACKMRLPPLSTHKMLPLGARCASTKRVSPGIERERTSSRSLDVESQSALGEVARAAAKHSEGGPRTRDGKIAELAAGITKPERELLLAAPCPVFATAQRIQRSIITRLHSGGMRAPPPIISRIFQEVSNGCACMHQTQMLPRMLATI